MTRKAFSITEIVMAIALMGLVGAGILLLLNTGSTIAGREVNLNVKLTAERFSLESINEQLQRGVKSIYVTTREYARTVTSNPDSDDITIFLDEDGHIILRTRGKDNYLFITEKIQSLTFAIPENTTSSDASTYTKDYSLSVRVVASDVVNDKSAPRSAARQIALIGEPDKGGDSALRHGYGLDMFWEGEAITYIPRFNGLDAYDLHIHSNDAENMRLDGGVAGKSSELIARYTIELPEDSTGDESEIIWYISDTNDAEPYNVLQTSLPQRVAHEIFHTGNDRVNFAATPAFNKKEGYVSYLLKPQTTVDGCKITIDPIWSGWVHVANLLSMPAGGGYYAALKKAIAQGLMDGSGNKPGSTQQGGFRRDFGLEGNIKGADDIEFIKAQGSGSEVLAFQGDLTEYYFDDAIDYEEEFRIGIISNIPFTNIANYSIVIEGTLINGSASKLYSCLLNGDVSNMSGTQSGNTRKRGAYSGLSLETNRNYGFIMRPYRAYFTNETVVQDVSLTSDDPFGAERVKVSNESPADILNSSGRYSTSKKYPAYYPKHLQVLGVPPHYYAGRNMPYYSFADIASNESNIYSDWNKRTRIMYTILEYKTVNGAAKFIVRAKYLRNFLDGTYTVREREQIRLKGDHHFMGKDFYLSEPMWFGDFVGAKSSNEISIKNYINYVSDKDFALNSTSGDFSGDAKGYYAMRVEGDTTQGSFNLLAKSKLLDMLSTTILPNVPLYYDLRNTFANLKRARILGMSLDVNAKSKITLHNLIVGPGFTPEELLAIMPEGAQLLSPKDLFDFTPLFGNDAYNDYKAKYAQKYGAPWYGIVNPGGIGDLNEILFGAPNACSDGRGNLGRLKELLGSAYSSDNERIGVTDIQYPYYVPYYLAEKIISKTNP